MCGRLRLYKGTVIQPLNQSSSLTSLAYYRFSFFQFHFIFLFHFCLSQWHTVIESSIFMPIIALIDVQNCEKLQRIMWVMHWRKSQGVRNNACWVMDVFNFSHLLGTFGTPVPFMERKSQVYNPLVTLYEGNKRVFIVQLFLWVQWTVQLYPWYCNTLCYGVSFYGKNSPHFLQLYRIPDTTIHNSSTKYLLVMNMSYWSCADCVNKYVVGREKGGCVWNLVSVIINKSTQRA